MEDTPVELEPQVVAELDQQSQPYIGRWNKLISNTNWDKGRIIYEWREALIEADAPAAEHSDEAWGRRVGGVSGQHVGRLRRVYHRFGEVHEKYEGLFWSHFQAALDWDDAEMWLEGAVQSDWSVSQMRQKRYETVGGQKPKAEDIVAAEDDEDFTPLSSDDTPANLKGEFDGPTGPRYDGPDFGDEDDGTSSTSNNSSAANSEDPDAEGEGVTLVRPFEDLPEMPDDLADAFDQLKLVIINHKRDQWADISLDDLLHCLDALKALAKAPPEDE